MRYITVPYIIFHQIISQQLLLGLLFNANQLTFYIFLHNLFIQI